jgi:hypothetical protein
LREQIKTDPVELATQLADLCKAKGITRLKFGDIEIEMPMIQTVVIDGDTLKEDREAVDPVESIVNWNRKSSGLDRNPNA